jgi:hypothetical protein
LQRHRWSISLGVCIAGLDTCRLFGGTLNTKFSEYTVLGEVQALGFAIQCVQDLISTLDINLIKSIAVFSDADHIQQLLNSNAQRIHQPISSAVQSLNRYVNQVSEAYPSVRVHINFLGNKAQRKNIYYKAAHKVARTVAQVSVTTV